MGKVEREAIEPPMAIVEEVRRLCKTLEAH
jgi:hypothetical protein